MWKILCVSCLRKGSLLLLFTFMCCSILNAQNISVSGKVKSSKDGAPLSGVSVTVSGTTLGTVTDANGNFRINVPEKRSKIVISSQGFASQEIVAGNRTAIDVNMEETIQKLDEIVVTGYGQQVCRFFHDGL